VADFVDPPEPPEAGASMKAKDLKNKVCLFFPTAMGEWPAKEATENEGAKAPQPYVECDVWVLDRAGVTESGSGVRVGWWRAVAQLKDSIGQYVAAKPVEQEDRSVILLPLSGEARDVASTVLKELTSDSPPDDDERPF